MHEHLTRPLRLQELADAAYLSPFHFDRVFRAATGASATAFASALRIDAAKRLLVAGDGTVTDVCYGLGYESLGSFVSRFSRSVGMAPGALRATVARDDDAPILRTSETLPERRGSGTHTVFGVVTGDVPPDSVVWIGAFARGIPDGLPLGGVVVAGSAPFRIDALSYGTYHVLALALPRTAGLRGYLAPDTAARVGKGGSVVIAPQAPARFVTIAMQRIGPTDPPVLTALPLIAAPTARSE